jgi:site-specific DNA-methyltransferase (adenine-specific)
MPTPRRRATTATSSFGVSKRESHDASEFYARFQAPEVSKDDEIRPCPVPDSIFHGDSRAMSQLDDKCVALVVTSPPYFAAKEYELALGEGHVPDSYVSYLEMLLDVFAECVRVLEPGGRIAVNVANLGRKPFRSLAGDVTRILQDDLGLLLRGEIVWVKGEGANGSCAWGSYASAANPTLRDTSERIIVASKGRFDRALTRKKREALGLPFENTISPDEFRALTLDVWRFQPASAKRIGHPAPFPVELPRRLIELLTYRDDVVLDPFVGSGQVAIAAIETGRHYVGYDADASYVELAERRIAETLAGLQH